MQWKAHGYRAGPHTLEVDALPADPAGLDDFTSGARKNIEPWLSAVFQAEHLNLLVGSGFTTAIARKAGSTATGMSTVTFGSTYDAAIDAHATASAKATNRGTANLEDQFRSALAVLEGLKVTDKTASERLR